MSVIYGLQKYAMAFGGRIEEICIKAKLGFEAILVDRISRKRNFSSYADQ